MSRKKVVSVRNNSSIQAVAKDRTQIKTAPGIGFPMPGAVRMMLPKSSRSHGAVRFLVNQVRYCLKFLRRAFFPRPLLSFLFQFTLFRWIR